MNPDDTPTPEATTEQQFVMDATDRHPDAARYDPRDPPATWLDQLTANPWNWVPDGSVNRLATADDPQMEAVEIAKEIMEAGLAWAYGEKRSSPDTPPMLPRDPMAARYVTGTLARFQNRLIKGQMGERMAAEYLTEVGFDLVEVTDDPRWDEPQDAENDGVDLVAQDGTTFQVKAYKTDEKEREKMNADYLVEVVNGEARRRRL